VSQKVDKVDKGLNKLIFDWKMAESVPFLDQNINLINFYKPSSTF